MTCHNTRCTVSEGIMAGRSAALALATCHGMICEWSDRPLQGVWAVPTQLLGSAQ